MFTYKHNQGGTRTIQKIDQGFHLILSVGYFKIISKYRCLFCLVDDQRALGPVYFGSGGGDARILLPDFGGKGGIVGDS